MRRTWTCIAIAEALALRVALPWGAVAVLVYGGLSGNLRADVGATLGGLATLAAIAASRRSGPPPAS